MRSIPGATYRLQLRPEFGFAAAAAIVPYLRRFGISHLYLSPVNAARKGSTHGYDVTDYNRLNPELGGEEGFARLSETARANGLGIILDFVPNHMAASTENGWWLDVLRHGQTSRYAAYFDIDWQVCDGFANSVVNLPLLGKPYQEALADIRLEGDAILCSGVALPLAEGSGGGSIDDVLSRQHYRLIRWQDAPREINYRRFFDINDLVGVDVEEAFDDMHQLVARLAREGHIAGLRLDHIDGVRDPVRYCARLQSLLQENGLADPYLVVEKILEPDETLPALPGICGTTGYEILNLFTRCFLDAGGLAALDRQWREICGGCKDAGMREAAKRQVLEELFPGGLDDLVQRLGRLDGGHSPEELKQALTEYLVRLPVYRTYVDLHGAMPGDVQVIEEASGGGPAADFLRQALASPSEFVFRLQQFSGPVMAKAIEDTLFYRNFRLLALNEVGGGPEQEALPPADFHAAIAKRSARQPHGLRATATHDTKRGEDARLRIAALSVMAEDWAKAMRAFPTDTTLSPSHAYMIYQSLIGGWPLDGVNESFADRVKAFAVKAVREGKERSRWTAPDEGYEKALAGFIDRLLLLEQGEAFRQSFAPLAERAARLGAACSLAQVALKTMLPGVPDIYQGCEFWDLSFVDPDNRRPVDYAARHASLERQSDWTALCRDWRSGEVKLHLTHALLQLRQGKAELFEQGEYLPVEWPGPAADVIAFERRLAKQRVVIAVCRAPAAYADGDWFDFAPLAVAVRELQPVLSFGALPVAVWRSD